jgi:hypothetical protein
MAQAGLAVHSSSSLHKSLFPSFVLRQNISHIALIYKGTLSSHSGPSFNLLSLHMSAPGTHSSSLDPSAQKEKANIHIMSGRTFHNTDSVYWLPNDDAENERLDRVKHNVMLINRELLLHLTLSSIPSFPFLSV